MSHAAAMVWIPAFTFRMGSDRHYPEEAPVHRVSVDGFWIDRWQVTNREFAAFVEDTGYVTIAERPLDPADFPGAPAENLVPGSLVFTRTQGPVDLRHLSQWWTWTPGASWRSPFGPGTTIAGMEDHPVVHVAFEDAETYARWAGKYLPTEAEWELAARGGLDGAECVWGDEPEAPGERRVNFWHGDFPWRPDAGYGFTTPVGSFPPNGYGLFDMAGTVWEWTVDWYAPGHPEDPEKPCCVPRNPRGRDEEGSLDPGQPASPFLGGSSRAARTSAPTAIVGDTAPPPADDRHRDEPHRVPMRRPRRPSGGRAGRVTSPVKGREASGLIRRIGTGGLVDGVGRGERRRTLPCVRATHRAPRGSWGGPGLPGPRRRRPRA